MQLVKVLAVVSLLMGYQAAAAPSNNEGGITAWFNPEWDKLAGDPANWTGPVKGRVVMVAVGTAAVASLGASMGITGGTALLLFGVPKLTWTVVLAVVFLLYAYKRGQKLLLLAGGWVGYCYFKGYSPLF